MEIKQLTYQEFLGICFGSQQPIDAPIYREIFIRLGMAGIIEPIGEIPDVPEPGPLRQITPFEMLEERLLDFEQRIFSLEMKLTPFKVVRRRNAI